MSVVDEIFATLEARGGAMYGGEAVTQLQHALQCATLAREAAAPDALVAAALLHDYGHLLNDDDAGAAAKGRDQLHEEIAANHLSKWFPDEVVEPVRLHVPAKRYLCAVDPRYMSALSPASVRSLEVQGGPFTDTGAAAFIAGPHATAAVELRRWDDLAKDPQARTDTLASFRLTVERAGLAGPR
jgi:[1-hydroxy-2-(trimethylamino)ethyl]phosphonate dioxygenase